MVDKKWLSRTKKHQCSPKWKENSMCYEQRQHIPDNIFSCNAVGIDFYLKKDSFSLCSYWYWNVQLFLIYMYSTQCHVHFVFVNTNYGSLFFRGDGSNLMNQNNSVWVPGVNYLYSQSKQT